MRRRTLIAGLAALAVQVHAAKADAAAFTDQFNSEWYTIVNAAEKNNLADVKTFISRHVNANTVDPQGRTALSYAAQFGNVEMAQVLLEGRASPDARDRLGNTPLHWAAEGGRVDVLKVLLAARANADVQNRQGITPLMLAIGHNQLGAVKALLAAGADVHRQDYTGRDAFGWATGQPAIARALQDAAKP
jgi:ankyrin repeat protein